MSEKRYEDNIMEVMLGEPELWDEPYGPPTEKEASIRNLQEIDAKELAIADSVSAASRSEALVPMPGEGDTLPITPGAESPYLPHDERLGWDQPEMFPTFEDEEFFLSTMGIVNPIFDAKLGLEYLEEDRKFEAALQGLFAIPLIGDALQIVKTAANGIKKAPKMGKLPTTDKIAETRGYYADPTSGAVGIDVTHKSGQHLVERIPGFVPFTDRMKSFKGTYTQKMKWYTFEHSQEMRNINARLERKKLNESLDAATRNAILDEQATKSMKKIDQMIADGVVVPEFKAIFATLLKHEGLDAGLKEINDLVLDPKLFDESWEFVGDKFKYFDYRGQPLEFREVGSAYDILNASEELFYTDTFKSAVKEMPVDFGDILSGPRKYYTGDKFNKNYQNFIRKKGLETEDFITTESMQNDYIQHILETKGPLEAYYSEMMFAYRKADPNTGDAAASTIEGLTDYLATATRAIKKESPEAGDKIIDMLKELK